MIAKANDYGWIPDQKGLDEALEKQPISQSVLTDRFSNLAVKDDNGDRFLWRALQGHIGEVWWKKDPRTGEFRLLSLNQLDVGSCFPAGTPITMADGSQVPIEEVGIGNMVRTHENRSKRVYGVTVRQHVGRMVTIKCRGDYRVMECTPDHCVVVLRDGKRIWTPASDVQSGDFIQFDHGVVGGSEDIQIRVSDYLLGCHEFFDENGIQWARVPSSPKSAMVPSVIDVDKDFARFIGLFLAEGHIETRDGIGMHRVSFTFHKNEREFQEFIVRFVSERFGCEPSIEPSERSEACHVRFSNATLATLMDTMCGRGCQGKRVPSVFFRSPEEIRFALVSGWMDGDGSVDAKGNSTAVGVKTIYAVGVTASHELAIGLMQLSQSIGLLPSATKRKAAVGKLEGYNLWFYGDQAIRFAESKGVSVEGVSTRQWLSRRFRSLGEHRFRKVESVIFHNDNCDVYNLEVEDDHSYVACGNAVHNCVGNATARGMDVRVACDIKVRRQPEVFVSTFAADALYGMGRQASNQLGNWDGSTNSWSIKGMTKYGTLLQQRYGVHDLRQYSASKCREWAARGLPADLLTHASNAKIQTYFQLRSVDHAWALLGAWCPFNICSSWGGSGKRGPGGVMVRSGEWNHSMVVIARRTYGGRRQYLVCQSWGSNWAEQGGADTIWPADMPWASFWIDESELAWIIKTGEVIAYVDHDAMDLPLRDWGTGFNW